MVNSKDYFLITYFPADPRIHIIGDKSATSLRANLAFGLLALAFLLCGWGAWGIGSTIVQLAKIRNLFKNGKVATATVGDWIKSPRRARQRRDEMTFHFVAANGRWYEGRSRPFNQYYQAKWPKGTHVQVVYDSITPSRCEPDIFKLLKPSQNVGRAPDPDTPGQA